MVLRVEAISGSKGELERTQAKSSGRPVTIAGRPCLKKWLGMDLHRSGSNEVACVDLPLTALKVLHREQIYFVSTPTTRTSGISWFQFSGMDSKISRKSRSSPGFSGEEATDWIST